MGFFDKLMNDVTSATKTVVDDVKNYVQDDGLANAIRVGVQINKFPSDVNEFMSMDGGDLKDPNKVAALAVVAYCVYNTNPELSIAMINFLKGPSPLSAYELQFLRDRLSGKEYLPASFFEGALPKNNYEPTQPYTISVFETPRSRDQFNEGYLKLFLKSGGADSARGIKLRFKPSTEQWFLWEQSLLSDIRKPASQDPWA